MSAPLYLGADIGGTKIEAVLATADGAVTGHRRVPTPAREGRDAVLRALLSTLRDLRAGAPPGTRVHGIGLGTHGVVSHPEGAVATASDALPGWTGTPLRRLTEEAFGVPVVVDNDVNVLAHGEMLLGAGRGHRDLLFVNVGTGIGGAVIVGGHLVRGRHGSGGELGHAPSPAARGLPCSCGGSGHLDTVASGTAIERLHAEAGGPRLTAVEITRLAERGDPLGRRTLAAAAGALGEAVGGLVSVLDPALVVIGGGVASAGAAYWDPLRSAVRGATLPLLRDITLTTPRLDHAAAARGAAALAFSTLTAPAGDAVPC
ncbi:ROK family protein [Streptomyces sp. SBT349]|uniref:ROK family protein n=1 Tax=Streptomyces sp. SBT349 TaxID=1580539 RepID=UPI00066EB190|nr:ROK family protein [Streptomyces sp. SBT349]